MEQNENEIKRFISTVNWLTDKKNIDGSTGYGILAAKVLSDYVNGGNTRPGEFVKEITVRTHRYLQNELFKEFIAVIRGWAQAYNNGLYDQRNEFAVKASKVICDELLGQESFLDVKETIYDKISKL